MGTLKIFCRLFYLSILANLSFGLEVLSVSLMNYYFIAQHNDTKLLLMYGLGDGLGRILGTVIIKYSNMTVNIFCSQSYGIKNYKLVGIYYQRGIFVVAFLFIILTPFMFFSDKFLVFIGVEKSMGMKAGDFIWVSLPCFLTFTYFDVNKCYLQS